MRRRGHEAYSGLAQTGAGGGGVDPDLDAQFGQDIRGARARGRGLAAMFGDGNARGGGDNRGQGGNIIGVGAVAAGAHDVDGVLRRLDPDHGGAHRLRRADQFLGGFAALAQRHQKGAELRRRRGALQNQRKSLPRPLARKTFAFGQRGENGFERAHATLAREGRESFHSRARSRKLRRILWPCCEVMLSG